MALTITTDNRWKYFKNRYEVPESVLASQFDYQDPEDVIDGFFEYRNTWYHVDQFMRLSAGSGMGDWDGAAGDSYFSGVLIKLSSDGEQYKVGTYTS